MISSASPPDPAVSTRSDSRSRIFCSESTIAGSSSTTRTVGALLEVGIRSIPLPFREPYLSTWVPSRADARNSLEPLAPRVRQNDRGGHFHARVTRPHRRVRPACHFGRQAGTRDQGWQVELEPDARQVRLALQLEPLVETLSGAQHGWPMPPHDWQ